MLSGSRESRCLAAPEFGNTLTIKHLGCLRCQQELKETMSNIPIQDRSLAALPNGIVPYTPPEETFAVLRNQIMLYCTISGGVLC